MPAIHGIAAYERKMNVTRARLARPLCTERLIVDTPAAVTPLQMPTSRLMPPSWCRCCRPTSTSMPVARIADLLLVAGCTGKSG
jgi:hypothetical protein